MEETENRRRGGREREEEGVYQLIANCYVIADGVLAPLPICPRCPVIAVLQYPSQRTVEPVRSQQKAERSI